MDNLITLCSECHAKHHDNAALADSKQFDVQDVVAAIGDVDCPVVTTQDIADVLGCTTETARRKLELLTKWGVLEKRKVGASAAVWWISEGER